MGLLQNLDSNPVVVPFVLAVPFILAQISATIAGFALISVSLGSPSERMRKRLRGIFQANVVALICFILLGLLILPLGTNYEFGDLRY